MTDLYVDVWMKKELKEEKKVDRKSKKSKQNSQRLLDEEAIRALKLEQDQDINFVVRRLPQVMFA